MMESSTVFSCATEASRSSMKAIACVSSWVASAASAASMLLSLASSTGHQRGSLIPPMGSVGSTFVWMALLSHRAKIRKAFLAILFASNRRRHRAGIADPRLMGQLAFELCEPAAPAQLHGLGHSLRLLLVPAEPPQFAVVGDPVPLALRERQVAARAVRHQYVPPEFGVFAFGLNFESPASFKLIAIACLRLLTTGPLGEP